MCAFCCTPCFACYLAHRMNEFMCGPMCGSKFMVALRTRLRNVNGIEVAAAAFATAAAAAADDDDNDTLSYVRRTNWFKSYLSSCTFRVKCNACFFSSHSCFYGVHRSSVLFLVLYSSACTLLRLQLIALFQ